LKISGRNLIHSLVIKALHKVDKEDLTGLANSSNNNSKEFLQDRQTMLMMKIFIL